MKRKTGKLKCYVLLYFLVWRKKKETVKYNTPIFPFFFVLQENRLYWHWKNEIHIMNLLLRNGTWQLQIHAETCFNLDLHRITTTKCRWGQLVTKTRYTLIFITQKTIQKNKKNSNSSWTYQNISTGISVSELFYILIFCCQTDMINETAETITAV